MSRVSKAGAILALALLILIGGCDSVKITRCFANGAVASGSAVASEVGQEIFRRGGNAFDVAVGVGFALAVAKPQAGNIGGGGFAVVREGKTGEIIALDFRETAPMAASRDMFLDDSGEVIEDLSTVGALSVGVPGTVAGLYALWERYATLPWEDLVTIAAELADTGFILSVPEAEVLSDYYDKLREYSETERLLYSGGSSPKPGDRMVLKDLAGTLFLIAAEGPQAFYSGPIAGQIVTCMEQHGGLITAADLEQYRPVWRQPVHFTFDSLDIYGMPPPRHGWHTRIAPNIWVIRDSTTTPRVYSTASIWQKEDEKFLGKQPGLPAKCGLAIRSSTNLRRRLTSQSAIPTAIWLRSLSL